LFQLRPGSPSPNPTPSLRRSIVRSNWHLDGAGADVSGDWKKEAQDAARAWARENGHTDIIWDDSDRKGSVPRGRRDGGDVAAFKSGRATGWQGRTLGLHSPVQTRAGSYSNTT
jgi:hypothetical protein